MPKRRTFKLTNALERVETDITTILTKHQSSRYFEGMVLMYSMIENVLKWTVFVKLIWDRCDRSIAKGETERLRDFCNQQDFYSALNLALGNGLIKYGLFRRLDTIRRERNDVLHQCYLFTHRRNRKVLRAKLRRMYSVAEEFFVVVNALVMETGADDSYDIFTVRRGKHMI